MKTLVTALTLATLVAAPAYAFDERADAATVNSGRYVGQEVQLAAYASARHGSAQFARPAAPQDFPRDEATDAATVGSGRYIGHDFQREGRGLGAY